MQSTSHNSVPDRRPFAYALSEFYRIFCAWNCRAELHRLVTWASIKKLKKQEEWYHFLLTKQDIRMQRYRDRFPKKTIWAYRLHCIAKIINQRQYYPPGSSRHYRWRKIDNRSGQ